VPRYGFRFPTSNNAARRVPTFSGADSTLFPIKNFVISFAFRSLIRIFAGKKGKE
jgi:hypothetical protein